MSQIKPFVAPYKDNYGSNYPNAVIAVFLSRERLVKETGEDLNERHVYEDMQEENSRTFRFRLNFWPDGAAKSANAVSRPIVDVNGDEEEFDGLFSFEASQDLLNLYNSTPGTPRDKRLAVIERYVRTALLPSIKIKTRG